MHIYDNNIFFIIKNIHILIKYGHKYGPNIK